MLTPLDTGINWSVFKLETYFEDQILTEIQRHLAVNMNILISRSEILLGQDHMLALSAIISRPVTKGTYVYQLYVADLSFTLFPVCKCISAD